MRAIILLAILGAALAVPKQGSRVVGGSETTIEQYPFMANMQFGVLLIIWLQTCGGTLITSTAILSAAHCYSGDSPRSWRAVLGSSLPSGGGTNYAVSSLILHPQYSDVTLDNDIAIVQLASAAQLSNSVGVARIAGPNYNLPAGTVVTATGWGTLWAGGPTPDVLQHVDINIIDFDLCAERYTYLKTQPGYQNWPDITRGMVCAGILNEGGKDACHGDSGGPLLHSWDIVYGVTSWGLGCADAFYPGVNARVSFYSDWIVANA